MTSTTDLLKPGTIDELRERLKMYMDIFACLERCVHEMIKGIDSRA